MNLSRLFRWFGINRSPATRGKSQPRRTPRTQLQLEPLEERALLSVVRWDGGAGTSNWHDAANWSTNQLPGVNDQVTIEAEELNNYQADVVLGDANVSVGSLTVQFASLTLNGRTLTTQWGFTGQFVTLNYNAGSSIVGGTSLSELDLNLNLGASVSTPVTFNFDYNLTLTGNIPTGVVLEGWGQAPQLRLTGDTINQGSIYLQGSDYAALAAADYLNHYKLINYGSVTIGGGYSGAYLGADVENRGTFHSDGWLEGSGKFVQVAGTLEGDALRLDVTLQGGWYAPIQSGRFQGTLRFQGGAIGGPYWWMSDTLTMQDATLILGPGAGAGTFNFTGNSYLQGDVGALQSLVVGGTLTAAVGFTNAGSLTLGYSDPFGWDPSPIPGILQVTSGTLVNTGTLTVSPEGDSNELRGALDNQGTVTASGKFKVGKADSVHHNSGTFAVGAYLTFVGASLTNHSGGSFTGNAQTLDLLGLTSFVNDGQISPGLTVLGNFISDPTPPIVESISQDGNTIVVDFYDEAGLKANTVTALSSYSLISSANATFGDSDDVNRNNLIQGVAYDSAMQKATITLATIPDTNEVYRFTAPGVRDVGDNATTPLAQIDFHAYQMMQNRAVWKAGASGNWSDASKWWGGHVPDADDEVFVFDPSAVVTLDVDASVKRVYIAGALTLTAGQELTVTAGASSVSGVLSVTDAHLTAQNAGTTFTAQGTVTLTGASLFALNGAKLILPTTTTYNGGSTNGLIPRFETSGAGSLIDLSGLTTFTAHSANGNDVVVGQGSEIKLGAETLALDRMRLALNGGTLTGGTLQLQQNSTLGGKGTISASLSNDGIIRPGDGGVGTLTVTGSCTQTVNGVLEMGLGGLTAGTQYDQLSVTGAVTLGGTLRLARTGAFIPAADDQFTLVSAASVVGSFAQVDGWDLGYTRRTRVDYQPDAVVLVALANNVLDLVVTDIQAPSSLYSDQPLEYSWTIKNQGTEAFTGTWTDDVYLSDDAAVGNDVFIGRFEFTGTLGAGQSVVRAQSFVPGLQTQGNRWLIVKTDVLDQVPEYEFDANNTLVDNQPVRIDKPEFPNLQVTSIGDITAPFSGQEIEVQWEVTNNGIAPTSSPFWYDRIYLSADSVLNVGGQGGDILLGTAANLSYLNPGESYQNRLTVRLPRDWQGPAYLLIKTDADGHVFEYTAENDNLADRPIDIALTPPADLKVTAIQQPSQAFSGVLYTFGATILNNGTGRTDAISWTDDLWLSTDQQLDAADIQLGRVPRSEIMEGGDDYTWSSEFLLPEDRWGDFWVIVRADVDNQVYEHAFEGNNLLVSGTQLHINLTPPPDLEASFFYVPSSGVAGQEITVRYGVANNGADGVQLGTFGDAFYLSKDPKFDPTKATRLNYHLPPQVSASSLQAQAASLDATLEPGDSYEQTVLISLPVDASGQYYLFVVTDDGDRIFEVDNDNNVAGGVPLEIVAMPADLQVTAFSKSGSAVNGQALRINWTVANRGEGETNVDRWYDAIYASNDAVFDEGDSQLDHFVYAGLNGAGLDDGGSYNHSELVTIPLSWTGPLYLFLVTDSDDAVFEGGGANNVSSPLAVPLTVQLPDLHVTSVSGPASAGTGQEISVTWTVENAGNAATVPGWWIDTVYVTSLDTGAEIGLGSATNNGALQPGASRTVTRTFRLPFNVTGDYRLTVKTNTATNVFESEGDNNIGQSEDWLTISRAPTADLQVTSVTGPASAISGQRIEVAWTVQNTGAVGTVAQSWMDTLYLSRDEVFDRGSDVLQGSLEHLGGLTAGASYNAHAWVTVPRGQSGSFHTFVVTDSTNRVYEDSQELNNTGVAPMVMLVTLAAPVDLVAGPLVIPATAIPGQMITLNYTVFNQGASTASGQWSDALYLSKDGTWSLDDVYLGSVDHRGSVAAGDSYSEQFEGRLPGVVPGQYRVIVRSDIRNQMPETNENNNLSASLNKVAIDVEALQLGQAKQGTIEQGQSIYYKVEVAEGETLLLTLNSTAEDAATELYVRYGAMPTRGEFDYSHGKPLQADQRAVVPLTQAGTYYVLAYADSVPTPGRLTNYTIEAKYIQFSVFDTNYGQGGTAGNRTIEINGAKFDRTVTAWLRGADGAEREAVSYYWVDSTKLYATFDLTTPAPGAYDVVLRKGGESAAVVDGLEVVTGGGAQVRLWLDVPPAIRRPAPGTRFDGQAQYSFRVGWLNEGLNDAPVPVFRLTSNDPFGVSADAIRTGNGATRWDFYGLSDQGGPPGILMPGEGGVKRLTTWNSARPRDQLEDITYGLDRLYRDEGQPFDWGSLRPAVPRDGLTEDQFDIVFQELVAQVGPTNSDYLHMLSENATLLPAGLGSPADIEALLLLEVREARARLGGGIRGTLFASDLGVPIGGRDVVARNLSTGAHFAAVTLNDGSFGLVGLPAGVYSVDVSRGVIRGGPPTGLAVVDGQVLAGVTLTLETGATLSGVLTDSVTGATVPGAVVTLVSGNSVVRADSTDNDGRFVFSELPPEAVQVFVEKPGYERAQAAAATLSPGRQTLDLMVAPEKRLTGHLVLWTGAAAEGAIVVVKRQVGGPGSVFVDVAADGTVQVGGLAAGIYDVTVMHPGAAPTTLEGVRVENGEASLGEVALRPPVAASLSAADFRPSSDDISWVDWAVATDLEIYFRTVILPVLTDFLGVTVHDLWVEYLSTTPDDPSPPYFFDDGSEIVEGVAGAHGVRTSPVTKAYLDKVVSAAQEKILQEFRAGTLSCDTMPGGVKTYNIYQLVDESLLHIPGSLPDEDPLKNNGWYTNGFEIPANIAGGIGAGDAYGPIEYDERTVTGTITVRIADRDSAWIEPHLHYQIKDTIDFDPGDPGNDIVNIFAVEPLYVLEVLGQAHDVPFQVDMTARLKPRLVTIPTQSQDCCSDGYCPLPCDAEECDRSRDTGSLDPNDITGPTGAGAENWVPTASVLPYVIRFENLADATAPAQTVRIAQQLDPDLDFRTFRVDDFAIGGVIVDVPDGRAFYQGRIDLTATRGVFVDVVAGIDVTTGQAYWDLIAIDPATGAQPADPLRGFLPPNNEANAGQGQGWVSYSVKPKANSPTGTRIDALATIVFDINEPIDTPAIFNTLDSDRPFSQVEAIPTAPDATEFLVRWSGEDVGSGVADFTIYVSDNGGPVTAWLQDTTLTEALFSGTPGRSYSFFSVARDNAGNAELMPGSPDAMTILGGAESLAPVSHVSALPAESAERFLVQWQGEDEDGGSGLESFDIHVATDGGEFTPWLTATSETSAYFDGEAGHGYAFFSRARDRAGNLEAIPATADANTFVPYSDFTAPASNVLPLHATSAANFLVKWLGQDETGGTGVASYDIYVSTDGGEFTLWLDHTTATEATFNGGQGHSYAFYSRARDRAGNVEATPETADATTTVPLGSIRGTVIHDLNGNGVLEPGEVGLAGWTVFLDTNGNGILDDGERSTISDAQGHYVFDNLVAGTYVVAQVVPTGWIQTAPSGTTPLQSPAQALVTTSELDAALELTGTDCGCVTAEGLPGPSRPGWLAGVSDYRKDVANASLDGRGLSVVLLDTGIDLDHPFFGPDADGNGVADRIVYQWDFADNDADASDHSGHGSHVASILASQDATYAGVAPGANLIVLKVFGDDGSGRFGDLEKALQWVVAHAAEYNVAAVNLSLGDGKNWITAVGKYGIDDELAALAAQNVIAVSASGNNYGQYDLTPGVAYPAADPNTIAVGAVWVGDYGKAYTSNGATDLTQDKDRIAAFSQRSAALLDVMAPGAIITGANATGGLQTMRGTSQATPFVTGAAVLAQEIALEHLGRRLSTAEFQYLLHTTGTVLNDGDDEQDNVDNTGADFHRLNVEALASAIRALPLTWTGGTVTPVNNANNPGSVTPQAVNVHVIDLASGANLEGIDFGNFQLGQVTGQVFEDLDGDGTQDAGEAALPGRTVFLDANDNQLLDLDERSVVTGADGLYTFTDLGPGSVTIRQLLAEDQEQTVPVPPNGHTVAVTSGLNQSGLDLGSRLKDMTPPTSQVAALPAVLHVQQFLVSWSGQDNVGGRGLANFDIFVSVDGGAFQPWQQGTTATSATYTGSFGHRYAFYSVATDLAGNRAAVPTAAQTEVQLLSHPPVLTVNAGLILNEGALAAVGNTLLRVTDPDTPATQLVFTLQAVPAHGQLLRDNVPLATGATFTQQDIDRGALTYQHDGGEAPSDGFTFIVNDETGNTLPEALFSITVRQVNDAPTSNGSPRVLTAVPENPFNVPGNTVSYLINPTFHDVDPAAKKGAAITGLAGTASGVWQYSLNGGQTWVNFGSVSAAQARLLREQDWIRFVPNKDFSGTVSISYRAWDQTSGVAGGLANLTLASAVGGSQAFSSDVLTSLLTVNTAPTFMGPARTLTPVEVNTVSPPGNTVSYLIFPTFHDVVPSGKKGAAVIGLTGTASGVWQYSLNAGQTWLNFGAVSAAQARLLREQDQIRFVPNLNFTGIVSISYRAWDQTSGTPGGLANLTLSGAVGGAQAFSSAVLTSSLTVTPANHAPTLAGAPRVLTPVAEDTVSPPGNTVSYLIFPTFHDVDPSVKKGAAITGLMGTANGVWQYSLNGGQTWLNFGLVSAAQARLLREQDMIRFVPGLNFSGAVTISYRAWDQTSGTAGGLADLTLPGVVGGVRAFSSTTLTSPLVVIPVNDAPTLTGPARVLTAVAGNTVNPPGNTVSYLIYPSCQDVDPSPKKGAAIVGLTGTSSGVWQYSLNGGQTWFSLGAVSDGQARLLREQDLIRFVPSKDFSGTVSISYRAWDQTSGTAGGLANLTLSSAVGGIQACSSTALTSSLTVLPVNSAPTLTGSPRVLTPVAENTVSPAGNTVSYLIFPTFHDVDQASRKGAAIVGLTGTASGVWQYSLNGGQTWLNFGPVSDGQARLLREQDLIRFVPNMNFSGSVSISYRGWDQTTGTAGGLADLTLSNAVGGTQAFSSEILTSFLTIDWF